ncbi:hypothetical protein ACWDKQ_26330 [Saccharopolyspora sp. NPDC000995]
MKVIRVAYSQKRNAGKYAQMAELALRLERARGEVRQRYGLINMGLSDRKIRDQDSSLRADSEASNWRSTLINK